MTTLLAVYDSDRCVGRCDANCYEATGWTTRCACICGGRNHGAGLERAKENVRAGVGASCDAIEAFAEARGLKADELVSIDRTVVPDARRAREFAYTTLNQLGLPFR